MVMYKNSKKGATILELMVAMSLSLIVVAALYSFYTYYSTGILKQQRKEDLYRKKHLMAYRRSGVFRRAKGVLSFEKNSLTLLSQKGDTLSYSFDFADSVLYKRVGEEKKPLDSCGNWKVIELNRDDIDTAEWALLKMQHHFRVKRGKSDSIVQIVTLKRIAETDFFAD